MGMASAGTPDGLDTVQIMSVPVSDDFWALARRPPVVIPPEEWDGVRRQWDIYATMTREQRLEMAFTMSNLALRMRRERLQRRFPDADATGIQWAVIREILEMEPGTEPVPR